MADSVLLGRLAIGRGVVTLRFTVEGEPVPLQRARSGQGRHYTPKKTRDYQSVIRRRFRGVMREHGGWDRDSTYRVTVDIYRRTKRLYDVDNVAKTLLDAITPPRGIKKKTKAPWQFPWWDDSQVVELTARKRGPDKLRPRIEVTIEDVMERDDANNRADET